LSYDFAETCVFGKQSLGSGHCERTRAPPLLPKLRGHFAEFLRESSLAPLSILYQPTCVGLRYRYFVFKSRTGFSRRKFLFFIPEKSFIPSSPGTKYKVVQECSPDFPSTPPFGSALGPDSPSADEPSRGTLRLPGQQIHTAVFVTQADILTSASSKGKFPSLITRKQNAPLPEGITLTHSFGKVLSPVHFRRKSARPMSCYALVQGWLLLGKPFGCLSTPTSFATEYLFRGLSW